MSSTDIDTSTTSAPSTDGATRPPLSRFALWAILGLVLLADALDMIDSTVTNIAAPSIVADLGGGEGLVKWLGASYALALGVLLVVGGRLGDKYGQRKLFLVGMAGFTLASAVAGLAPSPGIIIAARIVQGAFGALLIPQGMAIMTRVFPRDMMRKAFALFGPLLGIAAIGGPVLAGFLIDLDLGGLDWRPVFLINVVLGAVGIPLAAKILPHDDVASADGKTVTIDATGAAYLALTMFGLLFGLVEGSSAGWGGLAYGALAAGVVGFGLFVRRQRTSADPLIRPSLLANRGFTAGLVMGLVFFAASSGLMYVLSLFFQGALGKTPGETSLVLLPLTLGIMAASFATMGGLMEKLGRRLVVIGLVVTLLGAGWFLALVVADGLALTTWGAVAPIFVVGLGMGACFGTIYDIAIGDVAADEAGSASGSLTAIQQLANGLGSAVVTTVYFHVAGGSGGTVRAMEVSLVVVLAITAVCLPVTRLLPRRAPEGHEHG
jgi:EmrB/QacA subfamily drug resistance transporter